MSSLRRRQGVVSPKAPTTPSAGFSRSKSNAFGSIGAVRPTVLLLAKALFIPLANAAPTLSLFQRNLHAFAEDGDESSKPPDDPSLWIYLGVAVALVLLGGAFAGLTIALMGQDETYLQVIATSGEGSERRHAEKVLRLLNRGKHWVLVTLLLGNVITNETLPIVLDRSLGGGWPAVLGSTVLIVIFGEIAPQSVCVRYGLSIGSFMATPVLLLMYLLAPIAWPTAKLLDWLLGEDHGTMYKKAGLKTLVQLHKGSALGAAPEGLMEDEVTIINSVLDLKDKPVGDIMTPMADVFTMSADTVLDERMMDTILSQGYSRIPIYAPDNNRNFIGMLLVKILITYDPEDSRRVRDFALATLPETAPYTSCLDIINFFQEGKSHMVLVSDFPGDEKGALGVVTLEDVIEELIGEEIIDESDVFVDVHKAIRRMAPAPKQRFGRHHSLDPTMTNESYKEAGGDENEPLLGNGPGSRKPSLTNGTTAANGVPPTTFLMRRKSSTASAGSRGDNAAGARPGLGSTRAESYAVRANTTEMREHLRHLGPSNAASKPRATKFSSVKIKPGVGTIPENQQTTTGKDARGNELRRTQSVDPSSTQQQLVDTSSPVVEEPPPPPLRALDDKPDDTPPNTAGKDASDGVPALIGQGYGTMGSSSPATSPSRTRGASGSAEAMSAQEASKVAEEKARQDAPGSLKTPEKLVVGSSGDGEEDGDGVGEMGQSKPRSKSRRAARSGSITETMVEAGGMKKVVLEAQGEGSDAEEAEGEDGDAEGRKRSSSKSKPKKKGSDSS